MSTRKERVSSSFIMLRSHFKAGDDARAHAMLLRIVETEVSHVLKTKGKK